MSLREDLAKRLVMAESDGHPVSAWDSIDETSKELYLRIANECLRQMRWAQEKGMEQCAHEEGQTVPNWPVDSLTLAPEDWKP